MAHDSSDKEYKRNKGLRCVSSPVESSNSERKMILKARKSHLEGMLVGSIALGLGLKARRENPAGHRLFI